MVRKRKLSLEAIEGLKNSSALLDKETKNQNVNSDNSKVNLSNKKEENDQEETHVKLLKYPKNWHEKIVKARKDGVTSLRETNYILEALRIKMVEDGLM